MGGCVAGRVAGNRQRIHAVTSTSEQYLERRELQRITITDSQGHLGVISRDVVDGMQMTGYKPLQFEGNPAQ